MPKSTPEKLIKTLIWPIVVLVIAFGAFYLKPWQAKPVQTISVSATGTAKAVPNVATINATFQSQNPDINQARKETDAKISLVINALEAIGISKKDIQTQNISAGQAYEPMIYPKPTPTNEYSVNLSITVRDFKKADGVLAVVTQNGAGNIYGPNLQVDNSDLNIAKSKARESAVQNARIKAEELAKAAGRSVGNVTSIKEQGDYGIPIAMYARGGADLVEKANSIQPGQEEVSITLVVDFALK
jgi:hypothetical protein